MKSTVLWALIVLNAALLVSFLWRVIPSNAAMAQRAPAAGAGGAARVGDYLVMDAAVNSSSNGILLVLDQTNNQLSAVAYDDANHRVDYMGKVDLRRAFQAGPANPARGGARQGN